LLHGGSHSRDEDGVTETAMGVATFAAIQIIARFMVALVVMTVERVVAP
jgi:hypothetical protein